MSRDPIKIIIGLGFAGVLALMGLISFISLSQMNTITEQMSKLLEETNAKISAANKMRDIVRSRGDTINKMYQTDDFIERDEYRIKVAEYALQYRFTRDVLHSYHMSAREAKILDTLTKMTRIAKELNDKAAEDLLSEVSHEQIIDALNKATRARDDMLLILDELVLLQEDITRTRIEESRRYQETISRIILLLSLAAFFIALYIAQRVVRETSKKNSEIRYQATHDELTKLVNRKEFNFRLQKAFNATLDNNENHALCFLDLDKFKAVNDSCGHKAGDELLIQLTRIVQEHIRSHDTLARLGGDEFGLLLEGCSLDKAIEIAEGIVSLIKNYEFHWNNKKFHVGVSIGLVMINRETRSVENALSQADIACYAAKDMGRNQVHVHGTDNERSRRMQQELSWVADINKQEDNRRFSLYLQSIANIQSEQDTSMYEVLLRLNDDEGTSIAPGSFLAAAERFNLMKDVDYWVIGQAFKHLANLYKNIPECDVHLFINISANSLTNHDFCDFVVEQYKKYNISHNMICLEIAEIKAVKNIKQTADVISRLRKHNIKFALDDFGVGIPSFSYLKNLPVDYLKIDGNIIKNISQNTADKAMVAAINQIGKVMHIETIAKHVENVFILNQLKEIGINYAQGFYLDKPGKLTDRVEEIKQSTKKQSIRH